MGRFILLLINFILIFCSFHKFIGGDSVAVGARLLSPCEMKAQLQEFLHLLPMPVTQLDRLIAPATDPANSTYKVRLRWLVIRGK